MNYILIYTRETEDYNGYPEWETDHEEFETYDDLINFMAEMDLRYLDQYIWKYIFKDVHNMVELYKEEVNKRYMEMFEVKMQQIIEKEAAEKALAKQREEEYNALQEQRELALFKELSKKYGKKA